MLVNFLVAAALLLLATVVAAEENQYTVQITPFAGYRFGGTFEDKETGDEYELNDNSSYGLTVNFPSRGNTEWEVYYSKQSTDLDVAGFVPSDNPVDLDVEYLQIGGTYLFDATARSVPYFVATIGGTKVTPDAPNTKSDTFFSFAAGGGWKLFPSKRVGLRLDGRLLGTFVSSDSKIFCGSGPEGGTCAISTSGKILYQFELQAGIIFRF